VEKGSVPAEEAKETETERGEAREWLERMLTSRARELPS
jgi:hypothetical protein